MAVMMSMTEEEASFLIDVLDFWGDGYEDASEQTMLDQTIDSPEELLSAMEGLRTQQEMSAALRMRLHLIAGSRRLTEAGSA